MKTPIKRTSEPKKVTGKKLNRRTFVAMASFVGLYGAGYAGWKWLYHTPPETRTATAGAHAPLRKVLNVNESVFRKAFSDNHLVKTYPKWRAARQVRRNGTIGLIDPGFDRASWQLQVKKANGETLQIGLQELMSLPQTDLIFDFKCVEGWDQISHWAGVRFRDFMEHYQLADELKYAYVALVTPDRKYYVGIDMPSAMHPQTLLAYKVNNMLLPQVHGAPLRLIIPVKYGIKHLKRISEISFSNDRPPDYWAERGYDYYSGL